MIDVELECHLLLDSFSWWKIATDGFKKGLETRPQRHKHVASTLNATDDTCHHTDLAAVVVDEHVAGAVVFEVGDLQTVGVSYLLGLEGRVHGVHLDDCFGLLSLQEREETESRKVVCVCYCVKC